eukprot:15177293-Alexandrium_andersonii.AAC.1
MGGTCVPRERGESRSGCAVAGGDHRGEAARASHRTQLPRSSNRGVANGAESQRGRPRRRGASAGSCGDS